jgi:3-deoxy-D-manno-octulosonic-acid transferase
MIITYKVLTTILYPIFFLFLYIRTFFKKEDPYRFKEKILISHFNVKKESRAKLIWFHAASIGELKSIIPIIEQLNTKDNNLNFLITTTTFSSGNLAKIELEKFTNVLHRYFPVDVPFLIDEFLRLWGPNKIFLVDSEIWPNLILSANQLKIPIALINARLTSKSFNRWMSFPNIAKKIFGMFSLFICSNLETKKFLDSLKLKNVFFKGNIKLINEANEDKIKNINENYLLNNKFWFAASIHKGEDIFCLKVHIDLKRKIKEIITIIAPRHIHRTKEIFNLTKKYNLNAQILNNKKDLINKSAEIVIVNYFGALPNYFKYSKSVFIGKSTIKKLKNTSGQNPIEAAKLNCKIYHGPYVYNFKDIYEILKGYNISKEIDNSNDLSNYLAIDLSENEKKKKKYSELIKHLEQKTLDDTMTLVNNFLFYENK